MKIGLIGRCDNRGIGVQTWEFHRHMPVDRTLAVLMNDPEFPDDTSRFGRDVVHVDCNLSTRRNERGLDEAKVRKFLDGLDVVFAVETVYDWRLIDWAHEMGVKVVVQGNPEFYCHHHYGFQQPDRWVWPTHWMIPELGEHLPDEQLDVIEVPTVQRPITAAVPHEDELRVLHVVGKKAAGDRAGSREFIESLASLRGRVHVTITAQDGLGLAIPRTRPSVTVEVKPHTDDRWELYENQHVLVSPRKYGGLHLPALEAMACGLVVMMPDCSPNEAWPGPRIKARKGMKVRTPFGNIQTHGVHPMDIAQQVDRLDRNRTTLADIQDDSIGWADWHSWAALADRVYMPLFEQVCS